MKFEIPFNREFLAHQSQLKFRISWEEYLTNIRKWLIVGGIITVVGIALLFSNYKMGFIPLIIGGYCLIAYYQYLRNYRKERKEYFERVNLYIDKFEDSSEAQIWEFTDENLHFGDFQFKIFLKWDNFYCYRIIEENLFMYLEESDSSEFYTLGKAEIGGENFDKVVEFVKTKMEPYQA